jgi:glycosyltransferase involved in cell wall biosynthesis
MCSNISHRIHCPISSDALACVLSERDNLPVADFQFLGRLSPEKAPGTFMKIAERNPNFIFRMSGDGQERKSLEKYRDVHRIENIFINGFELPSKVLPRGKVLIIPSKYETFGMVIPELWPRIFRIISY